MASNNQTQTHSLSPYYYIVFSFIVDSIVNTSSEVIDVEHLFLF